MQVVGDETVSWATNPRKRPPTFEAAGQAKRPVPEAGPSRRPPSGNEEL